MPDNKNDNLSKKHKDISRIDQESKATHGWYVRLAFKGKAYTKFFSDRKFGGKYSALLAALAWRNETEAAIGKIRTDKRVVSVSKNDTGVVGVLLNVALNRYEVRWAASHGKQGQTTVSINKYGKKAAFEKACQIRKMKEAERLAG